MPDALPAALIAVLLVHLPIALWVAVDARRRTLRHPEAYWLGIVVPAAGFVVIPYYLSVRDSLPTRESAER